ncbi:hypothetical protein [Sphingomonas oryzagri]
MLGGALLHLLDDDTPGDRLLGLRLFDRLQMEPARRARIVGEDIAHRRHATRKGGDQRQQHPQPGARAALLRIVLAVHARTRLHQRR